MSSDFCGPDLLGNLTATGLSAAQSQVICQFFAQNATLIAVTDHGAATASAAVSEVAQALDIAWLILCGALVFIMHGGFAMLCAGAIRSKNTLNILLQTILDLCVSGIMWYCVGYAFAFGVGSPPNPFIGNSMFALKNLRDSPTGTGIGKWSDVFFQWAFCATATTIPAGAVAERFNFNAYLSYTILVSCFVYPVVVHWFWCQEGWATYFPVTGFDSPYRTKYLFNSGYIDFAGSGVVHMVGGFTGLMGAWLVGPRLGRFDSSGNPVDMPGHSATLVVLGTVLLWFGWYGFNCGSTGIHSNSSIAAVAGRAAVCTTLSGCAGGIACLINAFRRQKAWDLVSLCNGCLVGFVAVTASCHVLQPWAAILVGATGGLIFDGVCWIFLKLRIDDPLSAAPMHGFGGMWGVFFTGLLAEQEFVQQLYGRSEYYGVFNGSKGNLLAAQCIGILCIITWVCGLTGILFCALKLTGNLRISEEDEHRGLDASKHGGSAYNTHEVNGRTGHTPQLTK